MLIIKLPNLKKKVNKVSKRKGPVRPAGVDGADDPVGPTGDRGPTGNTSICVSHIDELPTTIGNTGTIASISPHIIS